jgi:hypothetical protein
MNISPGMQLGPNSNSLNPLFHVGTATKGPLLLLTPTWASSSKSLLTSPCDIIKGTSEKGQKGRGEKREGDVPSATESPTQSWSSQGASSWSLTIPTLCMTMNSTPHFFFCEYPKPWRKWMSYQLYNQSTSITSTKINAYPIIPKMYLTFQTV